MIYQLGTVKAGAMPGPESGMTFFIDMSNMANAENNVFDLCSSTGGDIRVYSEDGNTQYPRDIMSIDMIGKTGFIAFKGILDTGEKVRVAYDGIGLEPDSDSEYGSQNAWDSTYDAALTKSDFINRKLLDASANENHMSVNLRYWTHVFSELSATGPTAHQGCAYDGTNYFMIDNNYIWKRGTIDGENLAVNTDPCGDVDSNCNHMGAGEVYGGYLYACVEQFTNCGAFGYQHIARFNKDTLEYHDKYSITAQGHEAAALTIDPNAGANGEIYVVSYCDGGTIWRYDLSDGTYIGAISLPTGVAGINGVCLDPEGDGFILSGNATLKRVELDGTYVGIVGAIYGNKPNEAESLFAYDRDLYWWDGSPGGSGYRLHKFKNIDKLQGPLGGAIYLGDADEEYTYSGVGSAALEYVLPDAGAIQFVIQPRAYFNYSAIFDNSTDLNDWEGWFYSDGRMGARVETTLSYDLDILHPVSSEDEDYNCYFSWTKNGANVSQNLIIDGVNRASSSDIWKTPGSTFYLNGGHVSNSTGASFYWFVALRNIDISLDTDRLTTEYNNMSDPSSFWEWGGEKRDGRLSPWRDLFLSERVGENGLFL